MYVVIYSEVKNSGHRHELFDDLLIAGVTTLLLSDANRHPDIPHVRISSC